MAQYTLPERHENANGTITVIGAIPIEPPAPKPGVDRITYADLLKALRWDDATYEHALAFHTFPKPVTFTYAGWITVRRQAVFSRVQVFAWLDRAQAFAAKLPRKSLVSVFSRKGPWFFKTFPP